MYCPRCNNLCQDGITVCPDCGIKLSEGLPDSDKTVIETMEPVLVATVINTVEAGIMMSLLQSNGIPCFKKDKFTGGYMTILMGFSVFGTEIYVNEADYANAMVLISLLNPEEATDHTGSPDTDEAIDGEAYGPDTDEEDISSAYPAFYKKPYIIARIILGFMAAGFVLIFILNHLQ